VDAKMVGRDWEDCMGGALAASEGADESMPPTTPLKVVADGSEIPETNAEIVELTEVRLRASSLDSVVFAW
jgi:hypothetical protein